MQRSHILFSALILLSCRAACALDIHQPATVHLTLHDADHHPVEGARITLSRDDLPQAAPASATTDAHGTAEFKREPATSSINWSEHLLIEKEGYLSLDSRLTLFAGAQFDMPFLLNKARRTVLTIKGPQGQPAVGVPVTIWYEFQYEPNGPISQTSTQHDPSMHTDDHGQLTWTHGPIVGNLRITAGEQNLRAPDADQIPITLSNADYQRLGIPHTLHGKLLLPDGSPAKNWLIGEEPVRDASMGTNMGPFNVYRVSNWQRVQPDGAFTSHFPGNYLVLISPEGLPILYALNPSTWPAGDHAMTLTTPPIIRTITGRFLSPESDQLTGFFVFPDSMISAIRQWRVQAGDAFSSGAVTSGLNVGPAPGHILSDAHGGFSVPVYSHMYFSSLQAGDSQYLNYYPTPQIGDAPRIILKPYHPPAGPTPELKDITIVFVDESGKEVPGPFIQGMTCDLNTGVPSFADTRGTHAFVPIAATQLQIITGDRQWQTATHSFPLTGAADQRLLYPLSDLQRFKPIHGRLLDPAGNPVAHGTVMTYDDPPPALATRQGPTYTGSTTTDAQGHFEMPGAPDTCKLTAFALDADGHALFAPTNNIVVTPDHRDFDIHATPAGTVRVLLPLALSPPPHPFPYNSSEDFSPADHSLTYYGLPAGPFTLTPDMFPDLTHFTATTADVVPGKTTTVDLRTQPVLTSVHPLQHWATLTITADGKPASGAEVAIFTNTFSPEEIAQRIERWKNAPPDEQQAATYALYDAGLPALDALASIKADPALQARIDKLRATPHIRDGLTTVTLDLSGSTGTVRFLAQPGTTYVAAARIRGQSAGLLPFHTPVAPQPDPPLSLSLGKVRTVTMAQDRNASFSLSVLSPDSLQRRGLTRLLQNDELWADSFSLPLFRDTLTSLILEDIPVGTLLQIKPAQSDPLPPVTIIPGDSPQSLDPSPQ